MGQFGDSCVSVTVCECVILFVTVQMCVWTSKNLVGVGRDAGSAMGLLGDGSVWADCIVLRGHLSSRTWGSSAGVPVLVCVLVSHCQFVILSVGARDSVTCFLSEP